MAIRTEKGFTLIELMIALAITSVLAGTILYFIVSQTRISATNERVSAQQFAASLAMDTLVKGIIHAGYNTHGNAKITQATASSLAFQMDYDDDNTLEVYTYDISGNRLRKNGDVIFGDLIVNQLQFSYYDANDVETATTSDIRKIKIKMEVQAAEFSSDLGVNEPITMEVDVTPRNLGLGS